MILKRKQGICMIKVSVLISVYNGEAHLQEAVESILGQTFSDFEFVIVDDGSTDSTWQILKAYAAQDARIVLIRNEKNIGLERSLNKGLALTQGEYIARQDADDVSLPHRLELQSHFLDIHPEVGALGTAVKIIDQQGASQDEDYLPVDHESIEALLLVNNFLHHSTLMTRRHLMQTLKGYDESMRHAEDYDIWWRLSRISRLATMPDILLCRRIDDSPRISKLYREKQLQNALKISLKAVKESLGNNSTSLDEEAYHRFWWAYLRLLDKEAYERFWYAYHGQNAQLQWQDIQSLWPFWQLLATHPGGHQIWGPRLLGLAHDLLRRRHTVEGLQLLGIVARQFKTPIQLLRVVKDLIKPYGPAGSYQLQNSQQLKHTSKVTN